jgi:hypothetical protein
VHPSLQHEFSLLPARQTSTLDLDLLADDSHFERMIGSGGAFTQEGLSARFAITIELHDFVIIPARPAELLPCEQLTLSLVSNHGDSIIDAAFEEVRSVALLI